MMKTIEEKANDFMHELANRCDLSFSTSGFNHITESVTNLLKEQDRDTRHACFAAVNDAFSPRYDDVEGVMVVAEQAILNTKA
jgi:oligoendopeptidase F